MKQAGAVSAVAPYEPMTIARDSRLGWPAGTKASAPTMPMATPGS